jgi:mevalonate kinase
MPAVTATAPGKSILFGEHAVVYGRPAIAAPVEQVRAKIYVTPLPQASDGLIRIDAPDIDLDCNLDELPAENAIRSVIENIGTELQLGDLPSAHIRIKSTIPIAAGLGSGAAISVALIRAVTTFLGVRMAEEQISAIAYEAEKIYHGTPSGIDNTVVTYEQPIFFCNDPALLGGRTYDLLSVSAPIHLVIADSGIISPTAEAVASVRQRWQADTQQFEKIFDQIHNIVDHARLAIEAGSINQLGALMNENQTHLQAIGVSNPRLDELISIARKAGAEGAKLSGAGCGGNLIALVNPETSNSVSDAIRSAGAVNTIMTVIRPTK